MPYSTFHIDIVDSILVTYCNSFFAIFYYIPVYLLLFCAILRYDRKSWRLFQPVVRQSSHGDLLVLNNISYVVAEMLMHVCLFAVVDIVTYF